MKIVVSGLHAIHDAKCSQMKVVFDCVNSKCEQKFTQTYSLDADVFDVNHFVKYVRCPRCNTVQRLAAPLWDAAFISVEGVPATNEHGR